MYTKRQSKCDKMLTTGKTRLSIWMINVLFFQLFWRLENFQTYGQKELR